MSMRTFPCTQKPDAGGKPQRIYQVRDHPNKKIRAELIGTACPYCFTMLVDGIKEKGKAETMTAYDLSELVEQSM